MRGATGNFGFRGASVSETNQHDSFINPLKMDFFFSDKKKMLYYVCIRLLIKHKLYK